MRDIEGEYSEEHRQCFEDVKIAFMIGQWVRGAVPIGELRKPVDDADLWGFDY